MKPRKGGSKLEPFTWRAPAATQHQGLSVNALISSNLNSPGTACRAVTGHDSSPGKKNQTRLQQVTQEKAERRWRQRRFRFFIPESRRCSLFSSREWGGWRRKVGVWLCCPSSPSANGGAGHASRARCTVLNDKWCSSGTSGAEGDVLCLQKQ